MEEDAHKWNRVFAKRPERPPTPPEFVSRQYRLLQPGTVLDVASGDGSNALFLAGRGFNVTAIDISSAGLTRLETFATNAKLKIKTIIIDLDLPDALSVLEKYDNIVISRFKPALALWPALVDHLAPGGLLAVSTFNTNHHRDTGFALRFCLAPGELEFVHPALDLLLYETDEQGEKSMDSYLFQRSKSSITADCNRQDAEDRNKMLEE